MSLYDSKLELRHLLNKSGMQKGSLGRQIHDSLETDHNGRLPEFRYSASPPTIKTTTPTGIAQDAAELQHQNILLITGQSY